MNGPHRGTALGRVLRVPADFGVHPMTLSKWLWKADVEDGMKPELAFDGIPVTVACRHERPDPRHRPC